jgi:hypothetical protein
MSLVILRQLLAWSAVINYAILIVWFLVFVFAGDWMRQLHGKLFGLPTEKINSINYLGMAIFKLGILLLNLTPYLALRIIG